MSLNRDQSAFVMGALRQRLRSGRLVDGEPLTVADLARELEVSATPVREVLSRLAGESLIEDRRGRGYFAWRPDVADIIDLYQAQESLCAGVLVRLERCDGPGRRPGLTEPVAVAAEGPDQEYVRAFWEDLCLRLVAEAGDRFLIWAQHRLTDRLAPVRRCEPAVLDESDAERTALSALLARRAWAPLGAGLRSSMARRIAAADRLVSAMRLSAKTIS